MTPTADDFARWVDRHSVLHRGLPFPDWDALLATMREETGSEASPACLDGLAAAWLGNVAGALGDSYRFYGSRRLLLVTPADAEGTARLARRLDAACDALRRIFDGILAPPPAPRIGVLAFTRRAAFREFESVWTEAGHPASGGFMLPGPFPTVVFVARTPPDENAEVHELAHALVVHLAMPSWVDEGLAQLAEDVVLGRAPRAIGDAALERLPGAFSDGRIQLFWSGACFHTDDVVFELGYDLAWAAVRSLSRDPEKFRRFANEARKEDGGREALERIYGGSPGALVGRWLGAGDWEPDPETWVAEDPPPPDAAHPSTGTTAPSDEGPPPPGDSS
jgi:hypothetical protein